MTSIFASYMIFVCMGKKVRLKQNTTFALYLKFMKILYQMLNRDGSHLHEERAAAITVTLLICFPSRIKACPGNKSAAVISNDDLPTEGNSISRPVNEFSALEAFMVQIVLFSGW